MSRLANLMYRIGRAVDGSNTRIDLSGDGLEFGDKRGHDFEVDSDLMSVSFHTRDKTEIGGDFKPGAFTYAALRIGARSGITVFLNRRTTRKMLTVLQAFEDAYCKYGDGSR